MAKRSIKLQNKQLNRRLKCLKRKCYEYGNLPDIDVAIIICYRVKQELYTYRSTDLELWWPSKEEVVSRPLSRTHLHF
ncbi:hypothetical protein AOQ84DRAFT_296943 [Glonium stellatum]|uniref:MADS-box domain-containing protein n=1 Tax=Glonium stellatum TaxID=574774 RepID=A0A8E2EXS2_9PEZI|nr:hypothetical protein AOQ84DRAFT_296943 [Glonium stellatum]